MKRDKLPDFVREVLALKGSIFVTDEAHLALMESSLSAPHRGAALEVVDLDRTYLTDAHRAFAEAVTHRRALVWKVSLRFPLHLAHVAYVWFKGDGLVTLEGSTLSTHGKGSALVVLASLPAWLGLPPEMRNRLCKVVPGGGHWFPQGLTSRQALWAIGTGHPDSLGDPYEALRDSNGLEERQRRMLDLFPPDTEPTADGFDGYDDPIRDLIDRVEREGDDDLKRDLLTLFARQRDGYFAATVMKMGWPCSEEAEAHLTRLVVESGYLGGQKAPFWDLAAELVELGNLRIREWLSQLVRSPGDSGFENALYLVTRLRPWPDLVQAIQEALASTSDPIQRSLLRKAVRSAGNISAFRGLEEAAGADEADETHYLRLAREHVAETGADISHQNLALLARLHALIQESPSTAYQRSPRTFLRAINVLATFGSIGGAIDLAYLASVRRGTPEELATRALIAEVLGSK